MDKYSKKKFFLHIRVGLGVYIVHAKNVIFAFFFAPAIPKNVIFSDISGPTLGIIIISREVRSLFTFSLPVDHSCLIRTKKLPTDTERRSLPDFTNNSILSADRILSNVDNYCFKD